MRKLSKKITPFIAGVMCTLLACGMAMTAMAATGAVSFSTVNISLNGTKIASKGDAYTVSNGSKIPYSLSYTDASGGDTTYLPVRKISEILGIAIDWDGTTGTVLIGEKKPATQEAFYSQYPDVPDFGASTGATLMQVKSSSSKSTAYMYDMSQLNEAKLQSYITLLKSNSFSYIGSFDGPSGKVLVYRNSITSVSLGILSGYYAVMVSR